MNDENDKPDPGDIEENSTEENKPDMAESTAAAIEALQATIEAQAGEIEALKQANETLMSQVESHDPPPENTDDDEEFTLTLDDLYEEK